MENIEYSYIIKEFYNSGIIGKRFEKIQELEDGMFILKFGKIRINIELGVRMNISSNNKPGSSSNNFVQKTRKELKGFRTDKIYKHNEDKVIVFDFSSVNKNISLVFEMFRKGNAILIDRTNENNILSCYRREKWSDRIVKPNEKYEFPKSNIVMELGEAVSDRYIISSMMRLPLGKKYSKEILKKLGIDERKVGNELSEEKINLISKQFENLKNSNSFFGFYDGEQIIDFGICELNEYTSKEKKKFENLSKAAELFYKTIKVFEKPKRVINLERRLIQQTEHLVKLKKDVEKYNQIGNTIYREYQKIEELVKDKKGKREIEIEIY